MNGIADVSTIPRSRVSHFSSRTAAFPILTRRLPASSSDWRPAHRSPLSNGGWRHSPYGDRDHMQTPAFAGAIDALIALRGRHVPWGAEAKWGSDTGINADPRAKGPRCARRARDRIPHR